MRGQVLFSIMLMMAISILSFSLIVDGMRMAANLSALMIVLAGTFCAALMAYPWKKLVWALQMIRKSFRPAEKPEDTIQTITKLARQYRGGWDIRGLEGQIEDLPPGLLRTGIELIAYQCDRNEIERVLAREASSIQGDCEVAGQILQYLSPIACALGVVGMVAICIRFLGSAHDLQGVAGYSAMALFSAFYGVILAKLVLAPLAGRLKEYSAEEAFRTELIRDGILGIQDREHPREIRFKLQSRLASRGGWVQVPKEPELGLLPPEEVVLETKRAGSLFVN